MLSDKEKRAKEVFRVFNKKKILTMSKLLEMMICSERTIQRRLKEWKIQTSYNKNGRYYTLARVPRFNQHGIWKYGGVFFSTHGNLKNTVVAVIRQSIVLVI